MGYWQSFEDAVFRELSKSEVPISPRGIHKNLPLKYKFASSVPKGLEGVKYFWVPRIQEYLNFLVKEGYAGQVRDKYFLL